jgi:hypothetical protein
LIAPEAGKITRRKIRDEADRIIDQALQKKRLEEQTRKLEDKFEPMETTVVTESRYTI